MNTKRGCETKESRKRREEGEKAKMQARKKQSLEKECESDEELTEEQNGEIAKKENDEKKKKDNKRKMEKKKNQKIWQFFFFFKFYFRIFGKTIIIFVKSGNKGTTQKFYKQEIKAENEKRLKILVKKICRIKKRLHHTSLDICMHKKTKDRTYKENMYNKKTKFIFSRAIRNTRLGVNILKDT